MLSKENESIVAKVAQEYGLPDYIWKPIIQYESGGNPSAHTVTGKEDSRGLFQVNTLAHPTANESRLFDPEYNARWQIPELARFYEKGLDEGLSGKDLTVYVARYGQRPDWKSEKNRNYILGSINDWFSNNFSNNPSILEDSPEVMNVGVLDGTMSFFGSAGKEITRSAYLLFGFGLLTFTMYMVFVNNTKIEKSIKDTAIQAGKTYASGGAL